MDCLPVLISLAVFDSDRLVASGADQHISPGLGHSPSLLQFTGFSSSGTRNTVTLRLRSSRSSNVWSSSWIVATNLSGSCSTTALSQSSLQRSLVSPRQVSPPNWASAVFRLLTDCRLYETPPRLIEGKGASRSPNNCPPLSYYAAYTWLGPGGSTGDATGKVWLPSLATSETVLGFLVL